MKNKRLINLELLKKNLSSIYYLYDNDGEYSIPSNTRMDTILGHTLDKLFYQIKED